MALELDLRRFTIEEYEGMIAAGILQEDERLELLDGEIVRMPPIGLPHVVCVDRLNRLLSRGLEEVIVRIQSPVVLGQDEPQPDVVLLRYRDDFYAQARPTPDDILLLIEVADTSVAYDRRKLPRYAAAGIREVWVVNLVDRHVEVHTEPGADGYKRQHVLRHGDAVEVLGLTLKVGDILGEPRPGD
ncbi:MAG: Uma2 family endonuclease [Chloroflexi bacterium]|nr:Uma2 family endonuclease [Chloroflexota bacterium]MBV9544672.1 Uma2 family endonuclease [Chloroflexota bacterium]